MSRKVIIIEEWTKNLKNLVLSYGYTEKNYLNLLKNKWATARQSLPIGPCHDQGRGGGHTAVLQYAECRMQILLYLPRSTGRVAKKSLPRTPSDFWQQALV